MKIQKVGNLIPLVNGNALLENSPPLYASGTVTFSQNTETFTISNLDFQPTKVAIRRNNGNSNAYTGIDSNNSKWLWVVIDFNAAKTSADRLLVGTIVAFGLTINYAYPKYTTTSQYIGSSVQVSRNWVEVTDSNKDSLGIVPGTTVAGTVGSYNATISVVNTSTNTTVTANSDGFTLSRANTYFWANDSYTWFAMG